MELEKVFGKDYSGYKAGDFLAEESFVTWAKHPGENRNLDLYWEMVRQKYPELVAEIDSALSVVQILSNQKSHDDLKGKAATWNKIHRRIMMTRPLYVMSYAKHFINEHRSIAAVFISVLLITGAALGGYFLRPSSLNSGEMTTVYSPSGYKTEVTLPDNSRVWLNSKTTLRYAADFNVNNRKIYLDGEAYFDVKKGRVPFEVRTEDINIKVLGTAFNVKSYPEERTVEATLVRGSMIVEKIDKESGNNEKVVLKPNQKVVFEKEPIMAAMTSGPAIKDEEMHHEAAKGVTPGPAKKLNLIDSYDTQKSTGWKDGLLVIEGESLEDLSKKIERRYDVSVVFMSERLKKFKYTGTLREYSLEQVMKALAATSPINYSVDKQMVYIGENEEEITKYMKLMN